MSKARAAAAGSRFLEFLRNASIELIPEGTEVGVAKVLVHPDDLETMKKIIDPGLVDKGWDLASKAVVTQSTAMTSFQVITVAGLVAAKGPTAAVGELMDRVLPKSPAKACELASYVRMQAESNLDLVRAIKAGGARGKVVRASAGTNGEHAEGASPVEVDATPEPPDFLDWFG